MNYFRIGLIFIFIYIIIYIFILPIINACKSKNMLGGDMHNQKILDSYLNEKFTISCKTSPDRHLVAYKDYYYKQHNEINSDDYIFTYGLPPAPLPEKIDVFKEWTIEKISTGYDLITYKDNTKVSSILEKFSTGDDLWNNMGKNYETIELIPMKEDYYAILLKSNNKDTRILTFIDKYSTPGIDPITTFSVKYKTKDDIHETIRRTIENNVNKVIGYLWKFNKIYSPEEKVKVEAEEKARMEAEEGQQEEGQQQQQQQPIGEQQQQQQQQLIGEQQQQQQQQPMGEQQQQQQQQPMGEQQQQQQQQPIGEQQQQQQQQPIGEQQQQQQQQPMGEQQQQQQQQPMGEQQQQQQQQPIGEQQQQQQQQPMGEQQQQQQQQPMGEQQQQEEGPNPEISLNDSETAYSPINIYDEKIKKIVDVNQNHGTEINKLRDQFNKLNNTLLSKEDSYDNLKTIQKSNTAVIKHMMQLNNEKIKAYNNYETDIKKDGDVDIEIYKNKDEDEIIYLTGGKKINGIENKTYFRY